MNPLTNRGGRRPTITGGLGGGAPPAKNTGFQTWVQKPWVYGALIENIYRALFNTYRALLSRYQALWVVRDRAPLALQPAATKVCPE